MEHLAAWGPLKWVETKDGLEIRHDGDLPPHSGLGPRSSLMVGFDTCPQALTGKMSSKEELAVDAVHIEQNVIGEHVWSQDQSLPLNGGFTWIEFHRDGTFDVYPVIIPTHRRDMLG